MVVKLCQSVCRLGHQLFDKPLLQIENNSRHVKLGILHETLVKSFLIGMCWQQVLFAVYGKWIILISGITRKKKNDHHITNQAPGSPSWRVSSAAGLPNNPVLSDTRLSADTRCRATCETWASAILPGKNDAAICNWALVVSKRMILTPDKYYIYIYIIIIYIILYFFIYILYY